MKMKIKGFTLAEVLLTLGIIGIVAAMTIPTLIKKYEEIQFKSAWRKAYSTIMNAQSSIMSDNGGDLASAFASIAGSDNVEQRYDDFQNIWSPYLKVAKTCKRNKTVTDGCYTGIMKALTDDYTVPNYGGGTYPSFVLQDGSVFVLFPGGCGTGGGVCSDTYIFIDVNGSKSPNRFGKDIFNVHYSITKKRFEPLDRIPPGCNAGGWYCGEYYLLH